MNKLDKDYQTLLKDILDNGVTKKTRNGNTLSVFGRQIRHNMKDGFPLLTTKKMFFKGIATELLWFLRGETNIKWLVENDCHIWDGDCYKKYQDTNIKDIENKHKHKLLTFPIDDINKVIYKPNTHVHFGKQEFIEKIKSDKDFAERWGELGPIYGHQWRRFGEISEVTAESYPGPFKDGADQIQQLIYDLKNDPDSRRLMVTAWNPNDVGASVLPPCHYGFQIYTRKLSDEELYLKYPDLKSIKAVKSNYVKLQQYENAAKARDIEMKLLEGVPTRAISLMWSQRSVDTALGLPFNIASYGLLLMIIGKLVNMVPDELIGNLGDTHLYTNQIDGVKEQIDRDSFDLPTLKFSEDIDIIFAKFRGDEPKDKDGGSNDQEWNFIKKVTAKIPDFGYLKQLDSVITSMNSSDFILDDYKSHPTIRIPLSN